jgi:hypothetical protein
MNSNQQDNYIDTWYQQMLNLKWNVGYHSSKYFENIDGIKTELEGFFDIDDFKSGEKLTGSNWFLHILANQQLNSIFVMNEIAELIRYYNVLPESKHYNLRNKSGRLNYNELKEKFHEIYAHYLLTRSGFNPQIGKYYVSLEGHKKWMDMLLDVNGQLYNVEVTKYSDGYKDELLSLGQCVAEVLATTTQSRGIRTEEMFTGYVAFKTRNVNAVKKTKDMFLVKVKKFLHAYRVPKNNEILMSEKSVTEDYEFDIESAFSNNYLTYETSLKNFLSYVSFGITGTFNDNRCDIYSEVKVRDEILEANLRLVEKIKKKLKQHEHCPHRTLIVIVIEEIFSTHQSNRTIPVRKDNIDTTQIHQALNQKAILWLIFKEYSPKGVDYKSLILGRSDKDAVLLEELDNINQEILYIGF